MLRFRKTPADLPAQAVSVTDWGAQGNGVADDTAAFLAAIREAARQRVPVLVPGGHYLIGDTLPLYGVSLYGDPSGSWPADDITQPFLRFTNPCKPGILLSEAILSGLCIQGPGPADAAPAVCIDGDNARLFSLKLSGVGCGIATGREGLRGLYIRDVFLPDPQGVGVRLIGCRGETRIINVELWPSTMAATPFSRDGIGFLLAGNETVIMEDCFVWNACRAMVLEDGGRVQMRNCSVDFCSDGLILQGDCDVIVEGGTFWTHFNGIRMDHPAARLRLYGMDLKSNGAPVLEVRQAAALEAGGLIFRRTMDEREVPALSLIGGDRLQLTGCSISARCHETPAIQIAAPKALTVRHCVIAHPERRAFSAAAGYCLTDNTVTAQVRC